jgi:DNA polymerase III epsilon subunit-like protein
MIPKNVIIIDTENGGFSWNKNPILSIGLIKDVNSEISKLEINIAPPTNTWLEVPVEEHQGLDVKDKDIEYYLNLTSGEELPYNINYVFEDPIITAIAAEVNGFVELNPKWVLPLKHREAMDVDSADELISDFIFGANATPVAHNVEYDKGFIKKYLPKTFAGLGQDWFCTMQYFRERYNNRKAKGSGLANIIKLANYGEPQNHTALADAEACHFILNWFRSNPTLPSQTQPR